MRRETSTLSWLIALFIIFFLIIVFVPWQDFFRPGVIIIPAATPTPETAKKLNYDELLKKMFPSFDFTNGKAEISTQDIKLQLLLNKTLEDYFISKDEKNLLFIVQLEGMPHAGGLYHIYLGLFDFDGNLLTPASKLSQANISADLYFIDEKIHFGGDDGRFGFYDCKGIKYILIALEGCPVGTCCSGGAKLIRVKNNNFEVVQEINDEILNTASLKEFLIPETLAAEAPTHGIKVEPLENKIKIFKIWLDSFEVNNCSSVSLFKELNWDKDACRFD